MSFLEYMVSHLQYFDGSQMFGLFRVILWALVNLLSSLCSAAEGIYNEFTTIEGNTRGGGVWCYTSIVSENTRYLSSWTTQGFISTDLGGATIQSSGTDSSGGSSQSGGMQFDFTFSKYKSGGSGCSSSGRSGDVIIPDSQLTELHRSKVNPETSISHGKAAQQNHGKALSKPFRITITAPLLSLYPRSCYPIPISLLRSVRRFGCRQVYRLITRRTKV